MAPKTAEKSVKAKKAPVAKKAVKEVPKGTKKGGKKKSVESYKIYIFKVLKQVHHTSLGYQEHMKRFVLIIFFI